MNDGWQKLIKSKVLKPRLDRTVRPGKPQTIHFCGSFSLKDRFMGKTGIHVNRGQTSWFWEPWSNQFSRFLLPFESEPLKKKKMEEEEEETQLCWEYIMSLETLPLPSPEKHNMSLCFFFFFSLQSTSRNSLYSKTLLLGESSFKFRVWQGESMCDRVRVWEKENEKERAISQYFTINFK